ncbi:hypothetical protein BV25DRAFT_1922009 [Artomyces pyxidatus]|uniref:Uncharacterized protein n=1 Tax=Artomyces pyxidatus TaxID=48021 RepID=A0ACB8SG76_9AGAM|nr:hypothetical protein BV25DRAFT_1922009 [Artomyces pyxidatus]
MATHYPPIHGAGLHLTGATAAQPSILTTNMATELNPHTDPEDDPEVAVHTVTWTTICTKRVLKCIFTITLALLCNQAFALDPSFLFARHPLGALGQLEGEDRRLYLAADETLRFIRERWVARKEEPVDDDGPHSIRDHPFVARLLCLYFVRMRRACRHRWRKSIFSTSSNPYGLLVDWESRVYGLAHVTEWLDNHRFIICEDGLTVNEDMASPRVLDICLGVYYRNKYMKKMDSLAEAFHWAKELMTDEELVQRVGTSTGYSSEVPNIMIAVVAVHGIVFVESIGDYYRINSDVEPPHGLRNTCLTPRLMHKRYGEVVNTLNNYLNSSQDIRVRNQAFRQEVAAQQMLNIAEARRAAQRGRGG